MGSSLMLRLAMNRIRCASISGPRENVAPVIIGVSRASESSAKIYGTPQRLGGVDVIVHVPGGGFTAPTENHWRAEIDLT